MKPVRLFEGTCLRFLDWLSSRVSKKRPSKLGSTKPREVVDRFSEDYWRTRVFRNTYTHRGRRFVVGRWSVKIQIAGVRRTFSLESAELDSAAREALLLYQRLARTAQANAPENGKPVPEDVESGAPDSLAANRSLAAYWKPRLIHRKYVGRLPGRAEGEWSVLIDFKGERGYFPLGTTDPDQAAVAAAERFSVISAHGWNQARLTYFREITVGVVWSANPFACTYTTVLAIPATEPSVLPDTVKGASRAQKIIVVETDYGIRRAMTYWLSRQQSAVATVQTVDPGNAVELIHAQAGALTLVNIGTMTPSGEQVLRSLAEECPGADIFGYGVFEDSDHIFASLSGITGGYLLRRRPPELILEPALGSVGRSRNDISSAAQRARRYFERLFDSPERKDGQPDAGLLTGREYEILSCLSKGFQDKEIADRLGISIWTVHSHLRKIFVKYGVHSRTEAVVKYLHL